jgi:CheY-like chemotaxis protein
MKNAPYHILLADDDEGDRLVFTDAFSELTLNTVVNTVNDGIELMQRLKRIDLRLPHLLFLDLNMPPKNGLECLKEIKTIANLQNIFVAIYSTSDSEKDMEDTFNTGANIFITKPTDFKELKQVLEKAVKTALLYQDKTMNRENFLLRV